MAIWAASLGGMIAAAAPLAAQILRVRRVVRIALGGKARGMKPQLTDYLRSGLHAVEKGFDRVSLRVKHRLGWHDPIRILPYRGFGNRQSGEMLGRVLENKDIRPPKDNDPWWRNAAAVMRRFITNEIPGVGIQSRFRGVSHVVTTDEEGYFLLRFHGRASEDDRHATSAGMHRTRPHDGRPAHSTTTPGESVRDEVTVHELAPPELWETVDLTLVDRMTDGDLTFATGRILVPPEEAEFGVISDIDDTILESHATDFIRMARLTLFNNAYTRTPFRKVAPFYRALQAGTRGTGPNPIFYVSSSVWNIYDLLDDFMRLHGIPEGPILLRDLGFHRHNKELKSRHDHKLDKIDGIMSYYPRLPFVLIGDSGQCDPYIYQEVVRRHPGRIAAIYIRDVRDRNRDRVLQLVDELKREQVDMLLMKDAGDAARHAVATGLISSEALPEIVDSE